MYNIPIYFYVRMKLVSLLKMCFNETYIKFRMSKTLFNSSLNENCLKHGGALSPLIFNFALVYVIR
jgi:hypothetical protein